MYTAITSLLVYLVVRQCFMDEWVNLQYRLTTNLFKDKLTHNYFQARETQGLVQLTRSTGSFWARECTRIFSY